VCVPAAGQGRRRAPPVDLRPPQPWDPAALGALREHPWLDPVPDALVLPGVGAGARAGARAGAGAGDVPGADPADRAVARESIRLAFVAALQYLPPRQRAVLILRDVLRWPASSVAQLLETTVVSVNSALQRARAGLGVELRPDPGQLDERHRALLARYVDAFERFDMDELVTLLHDDVVSQMPPLTFWMQGPEAIRAASQAGGDDQPCRGSLLVPVAANGSAGFGQYRPERPGDRRGPFHAWALQVIDVDGGRIRTMTSFLDAATVFPRFGLPLRLDAAEAADLSATRKEVPWMHP
jgi:RNA polymerase sigma-70 factor (ECF subfamily)